MEIEQMKNDFVEELKKGTKIYSDRTKTHLK